MSPARRPNAAELDAAAELLLPDVIDHGLDVLFVGINPGLWSAAVGHHFARPGNRFWPALHRGGFTPRQFRPDEQDELLQRGVGLTNIVARATAGAADLTADELRAGATTLAAKVREYRPTTVAIVGVSAYRTAFAQPKAAIGPRPDDRIADATVWILPNPSGLNAHWQLPALAAEFGRLYQATR